MDAFVDSATWLLDDITQHHPMGVHRVLFNSLRVFLALLLGFACQAGSFAQTKENQAADKRLEEFFRAHLEETFALRPFDATLLGDHRFDHLLDDIAPPARQRWLVQSRERLASLTKAFAQADLSADGKVDYTILHDELVRFIWLAENTQPFEEDPEGPDRQGDQAEKNTLREHRHVMPHLHEIHGALLKKGTFNFLSLRRTA